MSTHYPGMLHNRPDYGSFIILMVFVNSSDIASSKHNSSPLETIGLKFYNMSSIDY